MHRARELAGRCQNGLAVNETSVAGDTIFDPSKMFGIQGQDQHGMTWLSRFVQRRHSVIRAGGSASGGSSKSPSTCQNHTANKDPEGT